MCCSHLSLEALDAKLIVVLAPLEDRMERLELLYIIQQHISNTLDRVERLELLYII